MSLTDWIEWLTYWTGLGPEPTPVVDTDSSEACVFRAIAQIIPECQAAQDLAEESGVDAVTNTAKRVIIGPHPGPIGDQFTIEELGGIEFQLFAPLEGGKTIVNDGIVGDRGNENNTLHITTRRFVRHSESEGTARGALYLFFLDKIARFEEELLEQAKANGISLLTIARDEGPAFGDLKSSTAQGEYLFTTHTITTGDFGGNSQ